MDRYPDGMRPMRARVAAVRSCSAAPRRVGGEPLTGRELDVLRLLQGSLSLDEIAGELYLSTNTVKTHAHAVYRKLGAHSRDEAVQTARHSLLI